MRITLPFILLCSFALIKCTAPENMKNDTVISPMYKKVKEITAPTPDKVPYSMVMHDDERIDNYYWMKLSDEQKNMATPDIQTQKVLDYLNAENSYLDTIMSHTSALQDSLYNEIVGRIKQTDMSVPYKDNGYYYITRYEEGKEYPIHSRKLESLEAAEEIMLDVNVLASGHEYYAVGGRSVSPDNKILAYGVDMVSRRIYNISFKNLETGELLDDKIENTTGGVVWANDNKTVFYTRKDASLRSYKIFKHKLGTDSSKDEEIFHESDETFNTFVYKSKSKKFIIIGSGATVSNEYRFVSADAPDAAFTLFQARERDLEYGISHFGEQWYVNTNKDGAKNFKLMACPLDKTNKENWRDVIPHRTDVLLEGVDMFKDFMVLSERVNGITQIRIKSWDGSSDHYIDFGQAAYSAGTSINPDFDTNILRVSFTSMTTPNSTYDYNVSDKKLELLKQQEVVGDFNADDYESDRIMVTARDGAQVPVSIVYKKGIKKDGTNPMLLYAYGSYGYSMDPYFSSVRLSLLDRGFVYAIAHIRGGQEMGRAWYEEGKLLNKKNTFYDFIDCGKAMVAQKYTNSDKLFAMGGSAGGLLMGAVINMEPSLWKGAIAAVPFVDVVTTMLDETIPLTTGEYDEWGNPNDKEYYNYIKTYSPYDQVEAKDYPALLITTGYHDSQVQYWEPAKWAAKLRELKTDNNPLMMYCNMDTGHGGASGRFKRYKETAMEYAFLLDLAGIEK